MRTWRVISIVAENKPHAHHKIHLHTMTVCNTRPVSLFIIIILLFFPTTEEFTYFKVINVFNRQNSWTEPFRKSSKPKLTILIPSFRGLRWDAWDNNRRFAH